MNERVMKLAEEAGWDIATIMNINESVKMQKFAELVAKECSTICYHAGLALKEELRQNNLGTAQTCAEVINRQFGIKQ